MKKIKYLIVTAALAACLVGSASAVTPTLKPPKLPTLPKISVTVPTIKFPAGYFDKIVGNVKIPVDKLPKLK
jgi:hypothetical protein